MKRTAEQWAAELQAHGTDAFLYAGDPQHLAELLRTMVEERKAYEALLHYAPNSAENIEPAIAARRRAEGVK
jgi:hypothetical protein